jgi:hypothetical protein
VASRSTATAANTVWTVARKVPAGAAVMDKMDGAITISWPAAG